MKITEKQLYQLCINDIQLITILLEHRNLDEASTAMFLEKEVIINQLESIRHTLGVSKLFEFDTTGDVVFSLPYFDERKEELRKFINTTSGSLRKMKEIVESNA